MICTTEYKPHSNKNEIVVFNLFSPACGSLVKSNDFLCGVRWCEVCRTLFGGLAVFMCDSLFLVY